jgi:hypothetical protein
MLCIKNIYLQGNKLQPRFYTEEETSYINKKCKKPIVKKDCLALIHLLILKIYIDIRVGIINLV